jgi:hypothetical protein
MRLYRWVLRHKLQVGACVLGWNIPTVLRLLGFDV